ncbi:MAG: DUF3179 domain-containing (seleno)protein [Chryseolinea sp.]
MKKFFYVGVVALIVYEILKVYFIMPMPGSQEMNSLDVAYILHTYRWSFRIVLGLFFILGLPAAFRVKRKWIPALFILLFLFVVYTFNFKMLADKMFRQPEKLSFKSRSENVLTDSSIVMGVALKGEAKAYPIRYLSYHHQVPDIIGGQEVLVTYCNVCRTGRVFEPVVKGVHQTFRLVGMDHFNAMFEDGSTGSWWRQATGEAVAGPMKGEKLQEVESSQMTLKKWFDLYPDGVVMQTDAASLNFYDSAGRFEKGKGRSALTRTDSLSWKDKSWIVGIHLNGESKAYDWHTLKEKRIINDVVGNVPVVIALAADDQSFMAFERPTAKDTFAIRSDTLTMRNRTYAFGGRDLSTLSDRLKVVKAYQEFWHSWRTFHPDTKKYE